ncbi:MAG: hypothetical protein DBW85_10305 [Synechococcus sp. MED-G71]|nr:MAG: hypothetical protein DBW85_10305 [Synechococcus sp. MED-G71]
MRAAQMPPAGTELGKAVGQMSHHLTVLRNTSIAAIPCSAIHPKSGAAGDLSDEIQGTAVQGWF